MEHRLKQSLYNHRLREERLRLGWSQRVLADRLGTTTNNVSRWELGQTTPGPYFRAKLCALFGKSAQALGLVEENPPPATTAARPQGLDKQTPPPAGRSRSGRFPIRVILILLDARNS